MLLLLLFSGSHHVPGGSDGDGPAHRVLLDSPGELHAGGALYQLYIYIYIECCCCCCFQAHTMYQVGLMETDQHIEFFWTALESFTQEELCTNYIYIYILSVVVVVVFRLTPCTRWVSWRRTSTSSSSGRLWRASRRRSSAPVLYIFIECVIVVVFRLTPCTRWVSWRRTSTSSSSGRLWRASRRRSSAPVLYIFIECCCFCCFQAHTVYQVGLMETDQHIEFF